MSAAKAVSKLINRLIKVQACIEETAAAGLSVVESQQLGEELGRTLSDGRQLLYRIITAHPKLISGHALYPGSILSAYNTGELSFNDVVRELERWRNTPQLQAAPDLMKLAEEILFVPLLEYTSDVRISESDIQRIWALAKYALLKADYPLSKIPGHMAPPLESEARVAEVDDTPEGS